MGDSKYYSIDQFLNIIFLTIFIVFLTTGLIYSIYKASKKISKKNSLCFILLIIISICAFSENVFVSERSAYASRILSSVLYVILNAFIAKLFIGFCQKAKRINFITYTFIGIMLIAVILKQRCFIANYSFNYVTYGSCYRIFNIYNCILSLFSLIKLARSKKIEEANINKKTFIITSVFLWSLPIIIFQILLLSKVVIAFRAEYICWFLIGLYLTYLSKQFSAYKISDAIFNDVKNCILDYVFIIDTNGSIVYKNKRVIDSTIFKETGEIDTKNIFSIFNGEISIINYKDNDIIQYKNDYYFDYSSKDIRKNEKIVGYILMFADITKLVLILNKLNDKQIEAINKNKELKHYKEIVYDLEKENEINELIREFAKVEEKSIIELKEEIKQLNSLEDELFIVKISQITEKGRTALKDLRKTVSLYLKYYGGSND